MIRRHWLIITTVDVLWRPNNREHNMLSQLADRFESVHVVFRRQPQRGGLASAARDALIPSLTRTKRGNVTFVAVNPLGNNYEGLLRDATGVARQDTPPPASPAAAPGPSSAPGRGGLSSVLHMALAPLGMVKDVSTITALAAGAAIAAPPGHDTITTAMGPWAGAAARLLHGFGRIGPWIYCDRDYEPGFVTSALRQRWIRAVERSGIRAAREVVTIGTRLQHLRRRETGRQANLVPSGVSVSRFAVPRAPVAEPLIVYAGNVAQWARLDIAVEALALLRGRGIAARLRVVGAGQPSVTGAIAALAAQRGVADAVELTGPVPFTEMPAHYAAATIGYAVFEPSPLRIYASPLKLFEYMAAGLPVLATGGTEAGDIVDAIGCGRAVDCDPAAVADAMAELICDSAGRERMESNAARAAPDFDWRTLMEEEWSVMARAAAPALAGRLP